MQKVFRSLKPWKSIVIFTIDKTNRKADSSIKTSIAGVKKENYDSYLNHNTID